MWKFIKSLYLTDELFYAIGAVVFLFLGGFFFSFLVTVGYLLLVVLALLAVADMLLLYFRSGVQGSREVPGRLSNGDFNPVRLTVTNGYAFPCRLLLIDELPVQFQKRDMYEVRRAAAGETITVEYAVHPVERGAYHFGVLNVYARSPLHLVARRYRLAQGQSVQVFPSFLQMRRYELLAVSDRLTEAGIKKIRRVGHPMEFDHIGDYVRGDDYRTLNWKATARRHRPMVNQFQDEKAQPVYAVINMGRVMKMPFNGLSLLDYAINASLVLLNIALLKQDRAGLVTFGKTVETFLPARNKRIAITPVMEALYNQQTGFAEPDYEALYSTLSRRVRQRSLLVVFTNFEGKSSLRYQLPYLQRLAKQHLVVVVFFRNTELEALAARRPESSEEIFINTVSAQLLLEKRQIVRELQLNGIQAVLTEPENATLNTLNKYLELKSRGLI